MLSFIKDFENVLLLIFFVLDVVDGQLLAFLVLALFILNGCAQVSRHSETVTPSDQDKLRVMGFSERSIWEIGSIAAYDPAQ